MKYENPLDIPLEKASFSVVDVETTGLSANKNRIIEIALVRIENLKITKLQDYKNARFQDLIYFRNFKCLLQIENKKNPQLCVEQCILHFPSLLELRLVEALVCVARCDTQSPK